MAPIYLSRKEEERCWDFSVVPALSYGPHHCCVTCVGDRRQVRCSFVSSRFPVLDRYGSLDFLSPIVALLLRTYMYVLCADLHKLASVNNKDRPRALSPDANFLVRDGSELISASTWPIWPELSLSSTRGTSQVPVDRPMSVAPSSPHMFPFRNSCAPSCHPGEEAAPHTRPVRGGLLLLYISLTHQNALRRDRDEEVATERSRLREANNAWLGGAR